MSDDNRIHAVTASDLAELARLETEMRQAAADLAGTQQIIDRQQQAADRAIKAFDKKLIELTDSANAVVVGSRAYWISRGVRCHINLRPDDDPESDRIAEKTI